MKYYLIWYDLRKEIQVVHFRKNIISSINSELWGIGLGGQKHKMFLMATPYQKIRNMARYPPIFVTAKLLSFSGSPSMMGTKRLRLKVSNKDCSTMYNFTFWRLDPGTIFIRRFAIVCLKNQAQAMLGLAFMMGWIKLL